MSLHWPLTLAIPTEDGEILKQQDDPRADLDFLKRIFYFGHLTYISHKQVVLTNKAIFFFLFLFFYERKAKKNKIDGSKNPVESSQTTI
jgi:hypothetical protein